MIFQVYFWIFLIYVIFISFGLTSFSIKDLAKNCLGLMNAYWFIPAYIGLYLFAPLLNAFCEKSSISQLGFYIVIFYLFQLSDSLPTASHYSNNGYSIFSFCGLYLIGRYVRLSNIANIKLLNTKVKLISWIMITTSLIALCALISVMYLHKGGIDLMLFPLSPFTYNNPLVIVQSVLIFIFFTKLNIKSNIINWLATGALAIYLLHMHPSVKNYYYEFSHNLYNISLLNHYLILILLFITVTLVAIPIDKIRGWGFEKIYSRLIQRNKSL